MNLILSGIMPKTVQAHQAVCQYHQICPTSVAVSVQHGDVLSILDKLQCKSRRTCRQGDKSHQRTLNFSRYQARAPFITRNPHDYGDFLLQIVLPPQWLQVTPIETLFQLLLFLQVPVAYSYVMICNGYSGIPDADRVKLTQRVDRESRTSEV